MKRFYVIMMFALLCASSSFGQRETIILTFTAVNDSSWIQLDSIKVMNRTQGGDTVIYYPDTVLMLDYTVGMPEPSDDPGSFRILSCYPNPTADQTTINFYVPQSDRVSMTVSDILGRQVLQSENILEQGVHSFRFTPGKGSFFIVTLCWRGSSSFVKILHAGGLSNNTCTLEYLGSEASTGSFKTFKEIQGFDFNLGDELLYIGYQDTTDSGMLDSPANSKSYTFQFATNIPCPGTPTVTYEGQVYNTIQIFSQCWLKENLNVGTMIRSGEQMTDNGILEKYCYGNQTDSCTKYGGYYQWNEMMQYVTPEGIQGICPPSWRIPTDEEWKVLEGAVDSQYKIGDSIWNNWSYQGLDAGANLKSTTGWFENGNGNDLFGFAGLPGGYETCTYFYYIGERGIWWSSSHYEDQYWWYGWNRGLIYDQPGMCRIYDFLDVGFSVRCLKDE